MAWNWNKNRLLRIFCVVLFLLSIILIIGVAGCATPITKEPLSAPTNLRTEGRTIIWDEVENANGYVVYFQNSGYETTETFYDLSSLTVPDTYKIELMAYSESAYYKNSDWVEYSYVVEDVVKEGYDGLGLKYVLLEDESGYEVFRADENNLNIAKEIVIPDYFKGLPVKRIGDYAFTSNISGRSYINELLCNTLTTSIQLPKHLESIGRFALSCMVRLEEVVIPDSVVEIEHAAFLGDTHLKRVVLPKGLKEIPTSCFADTSLEEINLPPNLEKIGGDAFSCSVFESPRLPHIDSAVSKIVIPDTVTYIGKQAFMGRENLKTVVMSKNLQTIEPYVFNYTPWYDAQPDGFMCFGDILYFYKGEMPKDYTVYIPSNIKSIASRAFYNQKNLTSVFIPDGVKLNGNGEGIFDGCSALKEVRLPSDLTFIGTGMFGDTYSLRSISLPDSLAEIGRAAFNGSGLKQVVIPDGVKTLENGAFSDCFDLTSVTLGKGVEKIVSGAFRDCLNLKEIYNLSDLDIVAGDTGNGQIGLYAKDIYTSLNSKSKIETTADGFVFYNYNGEYELLSYDKSKKEIVLPDNYNGKSYAINYAFYMDNNIEKVVIPEGINNLVESAFYNCKNLKEIVLPDSITEINDLTFAKCLALTNVTLGKNLVSIGTNAFNGCESLVELSFPDSLKTIGNQAFGYCTSLEKIYFNEGLESIGNQAFQYCKSLLYLILPNSVKSIGENLFYGCNFAGYECTGYVTVYYHGTASDWEKIEIGQDAFRYGTTFCNYSEAEPPLNSEGTDYDGAYWHYVDGEITPWIKQLAE